MTTTEPDENALRLSPMGDQRERPVVCPFHRRPHDEIALTWNWNGVCTRHQGLLTSLQKG